MAIDDSALHGPAGGIAIAPEEPCGCRVKVEERVVAVSGQQFLWLGLDEGCRSEFDDDRRPGKLLELAWCSAVEAPGLVGRGGEFRKLDPTPAKPDLRFV